MPSVISERLVRPLVPEGLKEESFWRTGLSGQNSLAWDNHADFTAALVDALTELTDLRLGYRFTPCCRGGAFSRLSMAGSFPRGIGAGALLVWPGGARRAWSFGNRSCGA